MTNISVCLPSNIEKRLEEEARLTGRNRSELVDEAVGEYLSGRQRKRVIEEMTTDAKPL